MEIDEQARARVGLVFNKKYTLGRLIGSGGMAAVYEGTHRNGHRVAIKVLHGDLAANEDLRARFLREGYVANKVDHPGAVRVIDDDTSEDGSVFLVMDLLEGETLDARAKRSGGRLPDPEVCALAYQALDVLAAAHEKGVIHRDIKPENLFLTVDGVLKVLDFGIARVLLEPADARAVTRAGMMIGTPAFMAPEQALGQSSRVGGQTDLWAIAATMFAMISGEYVHEAETMQEMLIRAGSMHARSVLAVAPDLPPRVAAAIDGALAFEPAGRWPDARAMQVTLEDAYQLSYGAPIPRGREPSRSPSSGAGTLATPVDAGALTEHLAFPLLPSSQKASTTNGLAHEEIQLPVRGRWGTILLGAGALAGVVVAVVAFEAKVPPSQSPAPALSARPTPAVPASHPIARSVSIAPAPSAGSGPSAMAKPLASSVPRSDAGLSIAAIPLVDAAPSMAIPAVNGRPNPAEVPTPTATSPTSPRSLATSPAAPACDPNFVVDSEGNKIFKPECFPGGAPPL
ncbi:MAG TPA: protein kinase [Polyangiaceae bacterium]|jgi:serine/threonine protein kinase